jgi:hypothetical protein
MVKDKSGQVTWQQDPEYVSPLIIILAHFVPLFRMMLYAKYGIEGECFFSGQIESTKASVKSSLDMSEGAAGYPSILYLMLVKKTSLLGGSEAAAETNKIEIKLKVNPQTGEIPIQKIKFRKPMTIDPAKGESLSFQMKTKGAVIDKRHKITLAFWKEGA